MKTDLLHSQYIIDGVQMALSPERMLRECALDPPMEPDGDPGVVADEHLDPSPGGLSLREDAINIYADAVEALPKRKLPLPFAGPYTAGKVAQALLDAIWMSGHFRLGDLSLKADWKWNDKSIGLAAAFYSSVESACNYADALGVKFSAYNLTGGAPSVQFKASTLAEEEDPEEEEGLFFRDLPYRTVNPHISRRRKTPSALVPEASDWLIYVPFDPCDFRLGGSALAEAVDACPSAAPDISDADYFIDCYELVRELVEDGVVKAGITVGDGGLLTALRHLALSGTGAHVSIRDICKAYGGESPVRVLFGEVPGVVLQIADIDYDYIDAEFILQDVVYFPLGHPTPGQGKIQVSDNVEIPQILESLLNTLEGED